ncbi:unnamed protein product [Thlaspi arvense]|uniref:Uncharacterized protein n=1 Tax=Thlaspi arvense TaxID=13288 RepID=A0AAU9SCS8_THLAR|nr:unnamed protein product [Thlaspi arvense]
MGNSVSLEPIPPWWPRAPFSASSNTRTGQGNSRQHPNSFRKLLYDNVVVNSSNSISISSDFLLRKHLDHVRSVFDATCEPGEVKVTSDIAAWVEAICGLEDLIGRKASDRIGFAVASSNELFEKSASIVQEPVFPPLFTIISPELHDLLRINKEVIFQPKMLMVVKVASW